MFQLRLQGENDQITGFRVFFCYQGGAGAVYPLMCGQRLITPHIQLFRRRRSQLLTSPHASLLLANHKGFISYLYVNTLGFCLPFQPSILITLFYCFLKICIHHSPPFVQFYSYIFLLFYTPAPLTLYPSSHIFSPHHPPPPLPPPPFTTDQWLIQSRAMLFMKRHFILQNHLCLSRYRVHHVSSISATHWCL